MSYLLDNCERSKPPSCANGAPSVIYDRPFRLPGGPALHANVAGRIGIESV